MNRKPPPHSVLLLRRPLKTPYMFLFGNNPSSILLTEPTSHRSLPKSDTFQTKTSQGIETRKKSRCFKTLCQHSPPTTFPPIFPTILL